MALSAGRGANASSLWKYKCHKTRQERCSASWAKSAREMGLAIQAPRAHRAERGAGEIADPFPPRHPPQPWHPLLQVCPLGTQPAWPRAQQESGALTHNALGWLLRGSEPPLSWAHFPKSLQPAHYWRLITHLRRQARAQHGQGQLVQRIRHLASHSQPLLQHLGFPAGAQSPKPQLGEDPQPPPPEA